MKKSRILTLLMLAAGFTACDNNSSEQQTPDTPTRKGYVQITVQAQAAAYVNTDQSHFVWRSGDKIGIYSSGQSVIPRFTLTAEAGESLARFSGEIHGEDFTDQVTLYGVYPYDGNAFSSPLSAYKLSYSTDQVYGNPTDKAAVENNIFMAATPYILIDEQTSIELSFSHLMSFWEFGISGIDPQNPVTGITVQAKESGATPFFSAATADLTATPPALACDDATKVRALSVAIDPDVNQSSGTLAARLAMLPVNFSGAGNAVDMEIVIQYTDGSQHLIDVLDQNGASGVKTDFIAGMLYRTAIELPKYVTVVSGTQWLDYEWRVNHFNLTEVTLRLQAPGAEALRDAGVQLVTDAGVPAGVPSVPGGQYAWNRDFDIDTGEFTVTVTGLTHSTTYYFTAWAISGSASSGSGSIEEFTPPIQFSAPNTHKTVTGSVVTRAGATRAQDDPLIYTFRTPVDGGKQYCFNLAVAGNTDFSFQKMLKDGPDLLYHELDPVADIYMLDRNLGAIETFTESNFLSDVAANNALYNAIGYYFQWGMKVPSFSPWTVSGPGATPTTATTAATQLQWVQNNAANQQIIPHQNGLGLPEWPEDGSWSTDPAYFPYQGNPCPAGYRIPKSAEMAAIMATFADKTAGGVFSKLRLGYNYARVQTGAHNTANGAINIWCYDAPVNVNGYNYSAAAGAEIVEVLRSRIWAIPVRCIRIP